MQGNLKGLAMGTHYGLNSWNSYSSDTTSSPYSVIWIWRSTI